MSTTNVSNEDMAKDPLVRTLGQLCSDKNIHVIIYDIIARGKLGASRYKQELRTTRDKELAPPLMWSWHGKRYLGGAHGVGTHILTLLFSAPVYVNMISSYSGNTPDAAVRAAEYYLPILGSD